MTAGFKLAANFVIHVNSPSWGDPNARDLLKDTIINALTLADEKNLKSVAFPSIGSGNNGFPKHTAANITIEAIIDYFQEHVTDSSIKEVTFVLFDDESVAVYKHELARVHNI